ncbi:MAG: outer membrane lipoprotein carrier protein LolA [Rickettsiales bacterium]|nr:outer membrane lipoprotein carrier protein LolA [Rickettsiales bacterium]
MKKILLFLITLFIFSFAKSSFANSQILYQNYQDEINSAQIYLNKLKTLSAKFIQLNPDSTSIVNGEFFLERPGKLLIRYNSPFKMDYFIINENFIQYDYDLDQVTRADTGKSPLNILLYKGVNLQNNKLMDLTNISSEKNFFELYFVNKTEDLSEEVSGLILKFTKLPVELISIKRVDESGKTTELVLSNIQQDRKFDNTIFNFRRPSKKYPTAK